MKDMLGTQIRVGDTVLVLRPDCHGTVARVVEIISRDNLVAHGVSVIQSGGAVKDVRGMDELVPWQKVLVLK